MSFNRFTHTSHGVGRMNKKGVEFCCTCNKVCLECVRKDNEMKDLLINVDSGLRNFFKDKINVVILLLVSLIICVVIGTYSVSRLVFLTYVDNYNKVENRYNCVTTSLEVAINKLTGEDENKKFKFDRYDGAEAKEQTSDQQIQRKANRKPRLKDDVFLNFIFGIKNN